jgi:hypothetical protein
MEKLVKEAEELGEVSELILVAQDSTRYGEDLYGENRFVELIQSLSKLENIQKIRLLYCYPDVIDDKLINEIATNDKVLKYIDIPDCIQLIDESTFCGCTSLQFVKFSNKLNYIGFCAFSGCVSLQRVYIPFSVRAIDGSAFFACSSLEDFSVDSRNMKYQSIDGILFDKDQNAIINLPIGKKLIEYQIPNDVEVIGYCTFAENAMLKNVYISSKVTQIGRNAFMNCMSLESICIPSSVIEIGMSAFQGCKSLRTIHFYHTEIEKCKIECDPFEGIDFETCTLYIPSGTRWSYRHHPVFSQFKNIVTERQK